MAAILSRPQCWWYSGIGNAKTYSASRETWGEHVMMCRNRPTLAQLWHAMACLHDMYTAVVFLCFAAINYKPILPIFI